MAAQPKDVTAIIPTFNSDYDSLSARMKKAISYYKSTTTATVDSILKDGASGGIDADAGKGKKGKGASSSNQIAAQPIAEDPAMRSRLEEQLGSLDDALRSSYSEIISLRISKDFVQKAVMDGENVENPAAYVKNRIANSAELKNVSARVEADHDYRRDSSEVQASVGRVINVKGAGKGAAAGNGDDDDVEMDASREQSVKCPLTQKLMEDPVRSDVCGHVFERMAVVGLMVKQAGLRSAEDLASAAAKSDSVGVIRCPRAGCGKMVRYSSLAEDTDAAVAVEEYRRKAELARKRKREADDEEDPDE